jgi:hypothetical protein
MDLWMLAWPKCRAGGQAAMRPPGREPQMVDVLHFTDGIDGTQSITELQCEGVRRPKVGHPWIVCSALT